MKTISMALVVFILVLSGILTTHMPIMEKRASWLELFYDVAFIALVAQLTYLASEYHGSVRDCLNIGIVGYMIFVTWWATTANRNLQPEETSIDKLFVQLQMVGVFMMSVTMHQVFAGEYLAFFLTLSGVRLLQAFMLLRMYHKHPETRPVTYNVLEGFLAASVLWALSGFLSDPLHFIAALMALVIDVLVPLTRGKGNTKRYLNVHHLQERLGLFLMLVIGESMIVVALSNSVSGALADQLGVVLSGLLLMIALWWLYFEHSDKHAGTRPREIFSFLHAHGLIFSSIILVSVGYKLILESTVSTTAFTFVVLGLCGIAIGLLLVRYSLYRVKLRVCSQIASLILLALGIIFYGYESQQYLLSITLITSLFALAALLDQKVIFSSTK